MPGVSRWQNFGPNIFLFKFKKKLIFSTSNSKKNPICKWILIPISKCVIINEMASGLLPFELELAQITLLCAIFSVPLYCNLGIGFKRKSILVGGKQQWWGQFYIMLVYKQDFGSWILLFGPFWQLWVKKKSISEQLLRVFFSTFCGQKLKIS